MKSLTKVPKGGGAKDRRHAPPPLYTCDAISNLNTHFRNLSWSIIDSLMRWSSYVKLWKKNKIIAREGKPHIPNFRGSCGIPDLPPELPKQNGSFASYLHNIPARRGGYNLLFPLQAYTNPVVIYPLPYSFLTQWDYNYPGGGHHRWMYKMFWMNGKGENIYLTIFISFM